MRTRVLAALIAWTTLHGTAIAAGVRPIRFERLSAEQGLSQATVMDILQDRAGYIWLATEDGLNRYDGVSFKVYQHDPGDAASLPSSFVWDVEEDAAGDVWIATSAGLAVWRRASDRVERLSQVPGHVRVVRLSPDGAALWVGTRDAGLLRLELASGETRSFANDPADPDSLVNDRIYALYFDSQKRLWIGTEGGLGLLAPEGKSFVRFTAEPGDPLSLSNPSVRAIVEDDEGGLWLGTSNGGLNRLDPARGVVERFRSDAARPASLAHDHVRALLFDADGRLWVGTRMGLDLFDRDRRTFTHYRNDPREASSLADNNVLALAQDRGGVIWVGTRLGGVHKWKPLSWQFGHVAPRAEDPTGLRSGRVTSFSEDRAGRLWIGTYDAGIYAMVRATGEMTAYRHDPKSPRSLGSDRAMALRHAHNGDLWVGTLDAGLSRLRAGSEAFTHYRADPKRPDGLSAKGVTSLLEDGEGRLWIGTYGGGLNRLDPRTERFTHYRFDPKDPESLSGDRVSSLAESTEGGLWVGTMENGLCHLHLRSGRFRRYGYRSGDPQALPSDAIYALFVDAAGDLWVGTHGGLARLARGAEAFETFTTRHGLASNVVYGILGDQQGRLWLSTNNGLSCFDPRSRKTLNYGVSDGLQAAEFNFGAWHKSPSGELFFGGINGFNAFIPERLRRVTQAPPLVLTAVTLGHNPIGEPPDQIRKISLGFRDKVLGLDFAALDFGAPHRNQFAYMLEGFDPEWVPLEGRRGVTYTNLQPGRYTFRLRGATSDGTWNEEGLAVPVEVAAAPWASAWALAGYAGLFASVVFGFVRIQRRKFEREVEYARTLELKVEERTRQLSERQSDLERLNDELAQASITDSLTGLANRRFLTEYLEKEVALLHRRYRKLSEGGVGPDQLDLAFLMVDLDHFKTVNDSAGHAAGDAVLMQLRDVLRNVCRASDIIVRWGGDEFLIVGRDLTGEGLAELAERLRARIAQHVFEVGEERVVRTTCSIGYARYPFFREQLDALSWEQVISMADRALYVAKASGRNAWVGFHPGLAAVPIQGLFGAICHRTQQLVREGTIRVTSSLTGVRNLVWDLPSEEAGRLESARTKPGALDERSLRDAVTPPADGGYPRQSLGMPGPRGV
jgi:diguanylate cyclase (GGDEF)-like protein